MKIGDKFSYGLWDNRQVPVKLHKLIDGYPAEFKVTETIPYLCVKGAILTWDDKDRAEMKKFMEGDYSSVREFFQLKHED